MFENITNALFAGLSSTSKMMSVLNDVNLLLSNESASEIISHYPFTFLALIIFFSIFIFRKSGRTRTKAPPIVLGRETYTRREYHEYHEIQEQLIPLDELPLPPIPSHRTNTNTDIDNDTDTDNDNEEWREDRQGYLKPLERQDDQGYLKPVSIRSSKYVTKFKLPRVKTTPRSYPSTFRATKSRHSSMF